MTTKKNIILKSVNNTLKVSEIVATPIPNYTSSTNPETVVTFGYFRSIIGEVSDGLNLIKSLETTTLTLNPYNLKNDDFYSNVYINKLKDFNYVSGINTLLNNVSGTSNIAYGNDILKYNITGNANLGIGNRVLYNNNGSRNIGLGTHTLYSNVTGNDNIAIGVNSMISRTSGSNNVAFGNNSLYSNINGNGNVTIGNNALTNNIYGSNNTALGLDAGNDNNTVGSNNTYLGANTQTEQGVNNSVVIGKNAIADVSNTIVFGTSTEQIKIPNLSSLGIVHTNSNGYLSSSLIVNADIALNANISDTKLDIISTVGKVANSATTATHLSSANSIVSRDSNSNFNTNKIILNDIDVLNRISSLKQWG